MIVYLYCTSCHKDLESGIIDDESSLCFNGSMYYADHVQKGHDLILRKYPAQCSAEFHSEDGKDSLPYSSHTLRCQLKQGHIGLHEYYGMSKPSGIDNSKNCICPRCSKKGLPNGRNESRE